MSKLLRAIAASLMACALLADVAAGQQLPLADCQRLKNDIDRYTRLRQEGGPAADMETWKRARRAAEERFRENRCKKYRKQLTTVTGRDG